ncbi:MAG: kinase [Candidatus Neomarinimicrobiota bacterium]|nr:MAG: kinase [Candidatus Neomarinimicrobiota bacterium]
MIISRTPYRISFLGGGTDYPDWYLQHGGAVLSTTIDKFCYIMCRKLPPFFEHKYAIRYSRIENCITLDDIQHPTARESLKFLHIHEGVEINHDGDLPARSGMGSSSSFTVGLLNALYALKGIMPNKMQLAREAIRIEQSMVRDTVGSQDQVAAAFGGFNHIQFLQNGEIIVNPLIIPSERMNEINDHLMLFYTGIMRTASNVADSYVKHIQDRKRQMRIMNDLVHEGLSILSSGQDLQDFGRLMHEAWQVKRSFSSLISNSVVDDIYEKARSAGALGGKLAGAGGGGFMLLFVPPEAREAVRQTLKSLIHVPFRFEFNGSQIVFYDPNMDYKPRPGEHYRRPARAFQELSLLKGYDDPYAHNGHTNGAKQKPSKRMHK